MTQRHGLVQLFTGEGKGKTSAALGTVLRASGHGFRTYIIFFMKSELPHGEIAALRHLPNVEVAKYGGLKFVNPDRIKPEDIAKAGEALAAAREAMLGGRYDLIVLDELNVAVAFKLVELDEVIKLIKDKPPEVELVLTGRYADPKLVESADLVTEMRKIKHPYDKGVPARRGIEY